MGPLFFPSKRNLFAIINFVGFQNGATLYKKGIKMGDEILSGGSNLPKGIGLIYLMISETDQ
jgi:Vacuolar protein sorting-associated protein 62